LQKPVRVGTPGYIGAASPLYTSAVGVVKDAVDSIKDKGLMVEMRKENENNDREWAADKEQKESKKDSNNGLISRIKEFFTDFF
jgi:cell division protein FtsA